MGLKSSFQIGELARRSARTVHAIRWYEAQGILPKVDRDVGGRRVYTQWHVDWLLFLGRLKATGMSIREMQRYSTLIALGDAGLTEQESLLRTHRGMVDAQVKGLQEALALIDRKLDYYRRRDPRKSTPQ